MANGDASMHNHSFIHASINQSINRLIEGSQRQQRA
jgi:hypothetical protein